MGVRLQFSFVEEALPSCVTRNHLRSLGQSVKETCLHEIESLPTSVVSQPLLVLLLVVVRVRGCNAEEVVCRGRNVAIKASREKASPPP
jgi:hypothetical protein